MSREIVIEARFEGPPGSANGGYASGVMSTLIDATAEVTLRTPPPLETPLQVRTESNGATIWHDDALVAEVRPTSLPVDVPAPPAFEQARRTERSYPGFDTHPFPSCFVCGPQRAPGDGLRVFPGKVEGRQLLACSWVPDESLFGPDGTLRREFVWSALDCPGNWAPVAAPGYPDQGWLLGRLAVEIVAPIAAGERCIVVGWPRGSEGRKLFTGSAIFSEWGELRAYSNQTCIVLR